MKSKAMRVLAMLLAIVMIATGSCVSAFAIKHGNYNVPEGVDENGKQYFTVEQAGTWLMNLLDNLLATSMNNGMNKTQDIIGSISFPLNFNSVDNAIDSIDSIWNMGLIQAALRIDLLGLLGDLGDLKADAISSSKRIKRTDATHWDYEALYPVLEFLYDNAVVLGKIVKGTFEFGVLESTVYEAVEVDGAQILNPDSGGIARFLANLAYTALEGLCEKEEGASGSGTTATTYDPAGTDVMGAIEDIITWALGQININGMTLDLTAEERATLNIDRTSLYDLFDSVIGIAINHLAVPLLKGVLLDACDIEVSDAFPNGNPEEVNNDTLVMIVGIFNQFFAEGADTTPHLFAFNTPGEQIEDLLKWFFLGNTYEYYANGSMIRTQEDWDAADPSEITTVNTATPVPGMNQYIQLQGGIGLKDDLIALLNLAVRLAIPLVYGLDFDYLPERYLPNYSPDGSNPLDIPKGEEGYVTLNTCYAWLLNLLLSTTIDGYYVNPGVQNMSEVGAYALACICQRFCPQYDYMDRLDANYEDNGYQAMDFIGTLTIDGQYKSGSTWVTDHHSYTVPMAALDMGITIGVFFLDGLCTADFSRVGEPFVTPTATRLNQFLKTLADWAVDKYLPMFNDVYQIKTKYNTDASVWKEVDEVLFGLIPSNWLPETLVDHTTDATEGHTTTNPSLTLRTFGDILFNWILGSVMDVDLQQLFGIFNRNTSNDAELAKPVLTILLNVIDRVFYIVLGKRAILPSNQCSRNAYATATTINSVAYGDANSLINNEQLGNLIEWLVKAIGGTYTGSEITQHAYKQVGGFDSTLVAKPILETVLPLIMGLDTAKQYTSNLSQGEISVDELQNYLDMVNIENEMPVPYVKVNVNADTTGSFYTVEVSNAGGNYTYEATAVTLPADYTPGVTYYTVGYEKASVDEFTVSGASGDVLHEYYTKTESIATATLPGDYRAGVTYLNPAEFVEVSPATTNSKGEVTSIANGIYYTAQNESSRVTLPDDFVAGTTYYAHTGASVTSATEGNFLYKTSTYTPVTLSGTAAIHSTTLTKYNKYTDYYRKAITYVPFNMTDGWNGLDGQQGRVAMAKFNPSENGTIGYTSSISSWTGNFYLFRYDEDFAHNLYQYRQYSSYLEDGYDAISEYKSFVRSIGEATAEWKAYLSGATSDIPDCMYPYYIPTNNTSAVYPCSACSQIMGLLKDTSTAGVNSLQAVVGAIEYYGSADNAFIVEGSTTNGRVSGQHNALLPLTLLPQNSGAGTTDLEVAIYTGWQDYLEQLVKVSNDLNNYYDGINTYAQALEDGRLGFNELSTRQLEWAMELVQDVIDAGSENSGYTAKSWNNLYNAYRYADAVKYQAKTLKDADYPATQNMITLAKNNLIEAFYALIIAGEKADLTQLRAAVEEARLIIAAEDDLSESEKEYTVASLEALRTWVEQGASTLSSSPEGDEQDDVNLLTNTIKQFSNSLEFRRPSTITPVSGSGAETENTKIDANVQFGFIYGLAEVTGLTEGNLSSLFTFDGVSRTEYKQVGTYGPGTGAKIKCYRGNQQVFEYEAILYGDLNGDARIDGTDKTYIMAIALGLKNVDSSEGEKYRIAGDLNGDASVSLDDAVAIDNVVNYTQTVDQTPGIEGSRMVNR